MSKIAALCGTVFLCLALANVCAQSADSVAGKIAALPSSLLGRIQRKTASLDRMLTLQTDNYLRQMARQEVALQKRLQPTDSAGVKRLFANSASRYAELGQRMHADSGAVSTEGGRDYLPNADSLKVMLGFLKQHPEWLPPGASSDATLASTAAQFQQLQAKLQGANGVRQFVQERKEQLRQYLLQHTGLPAGVQGIYADYNKQLYYYTQQVEVYKQMLNDPDRLLRTALGLLNKLPAFTAFMQQNSMLAGMFSLPGTAGPNAAPGMQTRDMVDQLIQSQVTAGGPGAASALSQSMQSAEGQLQQWKDKVSSLGAGGGDADLPASFKPNNQKTKTFWNRLQFGVDLQTTHNNVYFPVTTDLGLSVGYKLNNKGIIGIGASYKIGWGPDIHHIQLSSQGAGARSFLDWQIGKSLYATGGFEYNYQPLVLPSGLHFEPGPWQRSGLLGLSKVLSVKAKFFKQTKLQLLWDFLSYSQLPRTQALKVRVGYNF